MGLLSCPPCVVQDMLDLWAVQQVHWEWGRCQTSWDAFYPSRCLSW